jgi:GT2 family glycosyltransferase
VKGWIGKLKKGFSGAMNEHGLPSDQITLCMVNYNGERYLEESLGSVFSQRREYIEILFVDDGSDDRSIEIVRERFPGVKIIPLESNNGSAAARNAGFRSASCDLILFMDNDVSLTSDCPDLLLDALKEYPLAAIAMPRILYTKDENKIQYDGADGHYLGLMILHNEDRPLHETMDGTRKIGSVVTSCFLLDRKKWGDSDPFDESFIFNYEDHDFGLRARVKGNEIVAVPSACCYHREGTEGLSLREGGNYPKMRAYYLIRNRWQIILKNYELKSILLLVPIFFIYEIFQFVGVIRKGWFFEWLRALTWVVLHLPEMLRKRRIVQKDRKTPDGEIFRGGPIPFRKDLVKTPLEERGKELLDRLASGYWNKIESLI